MEIKSETTECSAGYQRDCNKRKYDEDSDSEQRRLTANSQERVRMQKINTALEELKKCLPEQFHLHHRRMSKIRALRCAMMYIRNLSQLIHEDNIRRQAQYMQAVDYMRMMYDHGVMTMTPETGTLNELNPTMCSPYFPYLGPLCTESVSSAYRTPVQNPPPHLYQPRPLDYSRASQNESHNDLQTEAQGQISIHPPAEQNVQHEISVLTDTPIKSKHHKLPKPFRYSSTATPLGSRIPDTKSETFTSPLVGLRNDNELDISFLSSNSDQTREDPDENQRPSSTLSDIVIGPC